MNETKEIEVRQKFLSSAKYHNKYSALYILRIFMYIHVLRTFRSLQLEISRKCINTRVVVKTNDTNMHKRTC